MCFGMNAQDMQIIKGYVQALPGASGRDETVRVMVIADDGTEYLILHKGEGTSLLDDINANVEIRGIVAPLRQSSDESEDGNDSYLLTVKSYRLTDGFDDPWYDDAVR